MKKLNRVGVCGTCGQFTSPTRITKNCPYCFTGKIHEYVEDQIDLYENDEYKKRVLDAESKRS